MDSLTVEIINKCLYINTVDDLNSYYEALNINFGVSYFSIIYFLNGVKNPEFLSFGAIDYDIENRYLGEKIFIEDPLIKLSLESDNPICWSDKKYSKYMGGTSNKPGTEEVISFGLKNHPITSKAIIIMIAFERGRTDEIKKRSVLKILPHLTDICVRQSLWFRPTLTPKESEVIRWCVAGKSYSEIAIINQISERTVKFHMKNNKKKSWEKPVIKNELDINQTLGNAGSNGGDGGSFPNTYIS